MSMKRLMLGCVLALASLTFVISPVSAKNLGYGAGNPGSITYSVGSAVAKLLGDKADLQTVVQPHGGPNAFIPAVSAGELDFCGANILDLRYALLGEEYFKNRQMSDLRVVSVLLPMRSSIYVRKDAPFKSIGDLKGKRFPSEYTAQKIMQLTASCFLANGGLTWDDVQKDPVPNVVRGADDFMAGKVDSFVFDVTSAKVQEAIAAVGGMRALSIDPSPEAMARSRKEMPVIYPYLMQPTPALPTIVGPTYVAAADFVLVVSEKQSADVVYKATKALYEGKAALTSYFKPFGDEFDPKNMAKALPNGEYHEGAIKFYKEVGMWPPKDDATQK